MDDIKSVKSVLADTISALTPGQLTILQKKYSGNPALYAILLDAMIDAKNGIEFQNEPSLHEIEMEFLQAKREQLEVENRAREAEKNRFYEILDEEIHRYRDRARKNGKKGTQTELYMDAGFDHNSWHRMKNARGEGEQYDDGLKRLVILFQMEYPSALEFLMLAGHTFLLTNPRDCFLVQCLNRHIWSMDEVDRYLEQNGVPALFNSS